MGWSVSRHSRPERKLMLFDRKLGGLRGAVKRGEGSIHLTNSSEKLRLAALALIKAERALIREYPERDPKGKHSHELRAEEERWLSLSIDAIVEEYGKPVTQEDADPGFGPVHS